MTSAVEIITEWLNEKGFNEAAIQLLQASGEVETRVDNFAELDWLDYQDKLKKAHLAYRDKLKKAHALLDPSGDGADLDELKKAHALLDPSGDEDDPLPF